MGAGKEAGSKHFTSLYGKPEGTVSLGCWCSLTLGSSSCTLRAHAPPAGAVPKATPTGTSRALASEGQFIKVFQFSFAFRSVPKKKDHFVMVSVALVMDLVVFLSVRTFLLHWSQPRAHSILLFVDFGPMYFMGIDTYINI